MSAQMSRSEKNSLCAGNASLWPSRWPQVEAFAGPAAVPLISLPRVARRSSPSCSSEPGLPFYPLLTATPFHLLKCWNLWPIQVSFLSSSCFYPKACLVSIAAVLVHYSFVQFYISLTEPVSIPSIRYSFGRKRNLKNVLYKTNCCPGPGLVFCICCVRPERRLRLRDDANLGRPNRGRQQSPGPGCFYRGFQLCCIRTSGHCFIVGVSIR